MIWMCEWIKDGRAWFFGEFATPLVDHGCDNLVKEWVMNFRILLSELGHTQELEEKYPTNFTPMPDVKK